LLRQSSRSLKLPTIKVDRGSCFTMKNTLTALFAVLILSTASCTQFKAGVTSLGNGITSLAQNKTLVADAGIALNVATQYEAIAKVRKVTPADFVVIAMSAVNQYNAAQAAPASPATVNDWVDIATKAVVAYDAAKGTSTK
jgi:hypothetical protein